MNRERVGFGVLALAAASVVVITVAPLGLIAVQGAAVIDPAFLTQPPAPARPRAASCRPSSAPSP